MNIVNNFELNDEQRKLLTKIISAPSPHIAFTETRNGQRAIQATSILNDLNMIEVGNDYATVTDVGKSTMRADNLIDDSGDLTDVGTKYKGIEASGNTPGTEPPPSQQSQSGQSTGDLGESFKLMREILFRSSSE